MRRPPTQKEIEDKRDDVVESLHAKLELQDCSYAEGIRDALSWVLGDLDGDLEA